MEDEKIITECHKIWTATRSVDEIGDFLTSQGCSRREIFLIMIRFKINPGDMKKYFASSPVWGEEERKRMEHMRHFVAEHVEVNEHGDIVIRVDDPEDEQEPL